MVITQHHTNHTNSPWTVQNHSRDFLTRSKSFGTEPRPSMPQQIPIHHITLKQKVKQVGEKPLPYLEFVKLLETGTHVKSLPWGATLLPTSSELAGPIAGNFREKVEPLSLKPSISLSLFALSLFLPFLPNQVGRLGQEDLSSHCHVSISHLIPWITPLSLSNHFEIFL